MASRARVAVPWLIFLSSRRTGAERTFTTKSPFRLRLGEANNDTEKTILFVRHAEGWHNKDERELPNWHSDNLGLTPKYRDAQLTPRGKEQCAELREWLDANTGFAPPDMVAVSTLTRAIQTATLAFADGPFPFVATELARERIADHECDHRSKLSELVGRHPHVDFGQVKDDEDVLWFDKENIPDQYESIACMQRGIDLLAWLMRRPERRIAVVSHWVFLQHLFSQFPDLPIDQFGNAEMRTVVLYDTLAQPDVDEEL